MCKDKMYLYNQTCLYIKKHIYYIPGGYNKPLQASLASNQYIYIDIYI